MRRPGPAPTVWRLLAVGALLTPRVAAAQDQQALPPAPPALGAPPGIHLPVPTVWQLPSGLTIWHVRTARASLVEAALVLPVGAAHDPAGRAGLSRVAATLLGEGRAGVSPLFIEDRVAQLGGSLAVDAGQRATTVRVRIPRHAMDAGVGILAALVRAPRFSPAQLQRVRDRLSGDEEGASHDGGVMADRAVLRLLDGRGAGVVSTSFRGAAGIRRVTMRDVREWHGRAFAPATATLVVVGPLSAEDLRLAMERSAPALVGVAGGARAARLSPGNQLPAAATTGASPSPEGGAEPRVVHVAGAAQASLRLAAMLPRTDDAAAPILAALLGGAFTSRLNQALRERTGLAYRVTAAATPGPAGSAVVVSAEVDAAQLDSALRTVRRELAAVRDSVLADDYVAARRHVLLGLPERLETAQSICNWLVEWRGAGRPLSDLEAFVRGVDRADAPALRGTARRLLSRGELHLLMAGDSALIRRALRDTGDPRR